MAYDWLNPRQDVASVERELREARWWYLHPGEEGYNMTLDEYLKVPESEWDRRVQQLPQRRAA